MEVKELRREFSELTFVDDIKDLPINNYVIWLEQEVLSNRVESQVMLDRSERPFGGWVSVKDKLPPLYTSVIIHGGVGYYNGLHWRTKMEDGDPIIRWKVKHWMELPKPPNM